MTDVLPGFDELPVSSGAPPGSSWGLWGEEDRFGALNLLTSQRALAAAASIRKGRWFALNLEADVPNPPLFGRPLLRHEVTDRPTPSHDDLIQDWNTQSSSQWEGFRHFPHPEYGHYAGLTEGQHGIDFWGARGLVGRCVLVDVDRWRSRRGRPLEQGTQDPITVRDLEDCIAEQGTSIKPGDVLLVRTGWTTWYRSLAADERVECSSRATNPGLLDPQLPEYLWNLHIAAIASDNPAVEITRPRTGPQLTAHRCVLALLGIPLGEFWDLDALAKDCAADGTYDAFFTSAPMRLRGGAASPPNAIAVR